MTFAPTPAKIGIEIVFDKASKFYEPGERVSGTATINSG